MTACPTTHLTLHVACGQLVMRPGDIDHQLSQVDMLSAQAASVGAKLILFAEAALHGYCLAPEVVNSALSMRDPPIRKLCQISRKRRIVIAVGAFEKSGNKKYVSQFVAWPDGRLLVQRKNRITPEEKDAGFSAGPEKRKIFEVEGVRCAIAICADAGIENLWEQLKRGRCQISLHPTAGGGSREEMRRPSDLANPQMRSRYLKAMEKVCFLGDSLLRCRDLGIAMIATNLAGDDGVKKYHPGHSSIVDSLGRLVAIQPGEYVVDFLRPVMIHGEVVLTHNTTANVQSSSTVKCCCGC